MHAMPPHHLVKGHRRMSDQQTYNQRLIAQFRANREQGGDQFAGRPLLLLTTRGAKTGRMHTTPMMYVRDGNRLLVIASNAGAPADPDWYRNLVAHPAVTVEVDAETYPATAVVLEGAERAREWDAIVAAHAFFADHQAKIARQIPVVALERQGARNE
jgi:deazaflavin-dependent oxidoreductase (nitroreductase family)